MEDWLRVLLLQQQKQKPNLQEGTGENTNRGVGILIYLVNRPFSRLFPIHEQKHNEKKGNNIYASYTLGYFWKIWKNIPFSKGNTELRIGTCIFLKLSVWW